MFKPPRVTLSAWFARADCALLNLQLNFGASDAALLMISSKAARQREQTSERVQIF
jgi:hypothetical protein